MIRHRVIHAVVTAAVIFGSTAARAQDTPPHIESTTEAAQEPGAERGGSFFDQLRAKGEEIAEETQIVERLNGDIDGWYPRLGGMTRGGGFALGPGYRFHAFDDRIFVDVGAGLSIRGYKSADANVRWLQALDDRFELWTDFRYEDFPQEDFFGMGADSLEANRTSYKFTSTDFSARALFRPIPWFNVGTRIGFIDPEIARGTDDRFPSIEDLFLDADAPGLIEQPGFLHTEFFGEADFRDVPGLPASGGLYRASIALIDDRDLGQYDHRRFDALAAHFVPIAPDRRHVVSGRIGLSYVNNDAGERVPFYFLPYVGGVDTIRSFREFRFKDENAMWLGAEYRWMMLDYLSLAGFVDAGKVAHDWNDIEFGGLKKGYGFGVRVHSEKMTFARVDFATGGGEGWQIFLKLGPRFEAKAPDTSGTTHQARGTGAKKKGRGVWRPRP